VQVRHVQVVALRAPALVEDLAELLLRLEVHPKRDTEAPLSCLRRLAIGVDEEQRDVRRLSFPASAPASAETAARPVQELAAVGADGKRRDAGDEGRRAPIAEAIAVQRGSAARAAASPAGTAGFARFEVEHGPGDARLQQRVRPFGHAGDRDDALREPVEIDLHRNGRARPRRLLRLLGTTSTSTSTSTGTSTGTSTSTSTCTCTCTCTCTTPSSRHPRVLVTLRQQGTWLVFLQHREVEPEVLVVVVRCHVEPLRAQREVG
jgi:hypothetical protein